MFSRSPFVFLRKKMGYSIRLSNGQVLRGFIKSPGENIRAMVLLVHGLGEHVGRYDEWSDRFVSYGIGMAGVDLPGHGRSDGRRGHIGSFRVTEQLLRLLIKETGSTFPGIPLILYGHSLGGGIVTDYLVRNSPGIKMAVVTSPWLKLAFEPPAYKMILAAVAGRLFPSFIQPSGLDINHLSHNAAVVKAYSEDPLVHDRISAGLFNSTMNAARNSLEKSENISVPVLLLHGQDDMISSPGGSILLAGKNSLIDLKIWPGGFHELHNEPDNADVFNFIINWIDKHLL